MSFIVSKEPFEGFNPAAVASSAFIRSEGEFLFLNRTDGKWATPGGKFEPGETPEQALIREIEEEAGINLISENVGTPITHYIRNDWGDFILHCYLVKLNERPEVYLSHEHTEYRWLSWHEAQKSLTLIEGHLSPEIFEDESERSRNRDLFVNAMRSYALGLKRKQVHFTQYENKWQEAYAFVSEKIQARIPAISLIEHIGSTSIPGLLSKPILDLLVVFASIEELVNHIDNLEQLGFVYKGDGIARVHETPPDPNRHFFAFYDHKHQVDFIHLQVVALGNPEINAKLKFRDQLRLDPNLVQQYNDVKMQLKENGVDRRTYSTSKTDFILGVIK